MKIRSRLLCLAILAATPIATLAETPWYAGISGGQSRVDRELVTNREQTLTNAVNIRTAFDAEDGAWKAFAGFRASELFAFEAYYADLGDHRMVTDMLSGAPGEPARISIDRGITGYGIDLLASPPLGWERLRLFARAGLFRSRIRAHAELEGANIRFTDTPFEVRSRTTTRHENVFKAGIGADWWIARNIAARLELERYHEVGIPFRIGGQGTTGEADVDVVSLSVLMRF